MASSATRPTEYKPGAPLERYSAERRRREVATQGAGLNAGSAGAGLAGATLGNAKIAGTRVGQHTLSQAKRRAEASKHPVAPQIDRISRAGKWAAKNPRSTAAGVIGLSAVSGSLRVLGRMRENEEAGISQGIGRIKAGESYSNTRRRTLSKGIARAALMASDADLSDPRLRRVVQLVNDHPKRILLGAAGGTLTATGGGSVVARSNRKRQAAQLRGSVNKRGGQGPMNVLEHFGTPRKAAATLGRNPGHIAAGSVLGAGLGAQARPLERRRNEGQRRRADKASAAIVGGAIGQGAWLGTGYSIRSQGHKVERQRPEGMSRSAHTKVMRDHHKKYGVPTNTKPDRAHAPAFNRNYPASLPAAKYKRRLGQMSGKRGAAMNAAAVGVGMVGGASAFGRKQTVGKALYQQDSHVNPLHAAGFAAGGVLAAYGLGHSGVVGRALALGVKAASGKNNTLALEALRRAEMARGSLRVGMAPGETALRRIKAVDTAVRAVPRPLRGDVALAAGILLAGQSRPVVDTRYRQVSTPVRGGRGFW